MKLTKPFVKLSLTAMLMLSILLLTGCSRPTARFLLSGEIKKVDGGWLVPEKEFAELVECCKACVEVEF